MLQSCSVGPEADFWALGVIIFRLLYGSVPFAGETEYLTFEKILNLDFEFPETALSAEKDLISKLLTIDPQKRLTDVQTIKNHEFFKSIDDWSRLHKCRALVRNAL